MKESPFIYGSTVSLKSFTNREKEAEKLFHNLTTGINTMIISPRRWGKSYLVEKVTDDINRKEKKFKTLIIDLCQYTALSKRNRKHKYHTTKLT